MSSASCSTQSSNCSPHFIYYAGKLEDLFRGSLAYIETFNLGSWQQEEFHFRMEILAYNLQGRRLDISIAMWLTERWN
jgi:hypothetical protein